MLPILGDGNPCLLSGQKRPENDIERTLGGETRRKADQNGHLEADLWGAYPGILRRRLNLDPFSALRGIHLELRGTGSGAQRGRIGPGE